jgi:hypothetical protein
MLSSIVLRLASLIWTYSIAREVALVSLVISNSDAAQHTVQKSVPVVN